MAQTRMEKIGTIYSRLLGLYKSGAAKYENRPLWFDIYESFPPKYEPRWDRHQLSYGTGGNVAKLGPPRKILYKEDVVRAQFFKVFGAEDQDLVGGELRETDRKLQHTYNLFETEKDNIAQKFVDKYYELENTTPVGASRERNIFRETVDALELEGINLLNPSKSVNPDPTPEIEEVTAAEEEPKMKRPSLREIFQKESERSSEDDR